MELVVDRKWKKQGYTISNLIINGKWFCNVLEDTDRGLDNSMNLNRILELKKPSITAIPKGKYKITLDVYSPKFGSRAFYKRICNGKVPRLLNVKGFEGILIHAGNTAKDSAGCLLVGRNLKKGKVLNSQATFEKLYKILLTDKNNLTIEIK